MEREIDEFLERVVTKYATNSSTHAQILEKVAEKARDFDDPAKSTRHAPKPACGDLSTTSTHFPAIFHTVEEREALTVRENAEVRSWFCVKSGASFHVHVLCMCRHLLPFYAPSHSVFVCSMSRRLRQPLAICRASQFVSFCLAASTLCIRVTITPCVKRRCLATFLWPACTLVRVFC